MPTRAEVYAALDGERAYQDVRWAKDAAIGGVHVHSFEEWILYIEDYLADAKHILSREDTQVANAKVAHIMRKVTAMGVAAMEQLGAPART